MFGTNIISDINLNVTMVLSIFTVFTNPLELDVCCAACPMTRASLGFGSTVCHSLGLRGLGAFSLYILGLRMIGYSGALVLARVAETPTNAVMPQYLTCCSCRC